MSFAANLCSDGELSDMTMISRRSLLATPALLTALGPSLAEAQAAQPLRIAMSIGDVPRLWGGPEAGFEGVRFGSYFVYDALALWDLSKADAPSGLMPGLATSWRVDEADRRRWIIELRQGVKFHDGTPFDADAAIWNFDSILNNQVPQFEPTRSALVRGRITSIGSYEKLGSHRIAITTRAIDASLPFQLAFIWFASPTHWQALGGDWQRPQSIRHRSLQGHQCHAPPARGFGGESRLLGPEPHPQGAAYRLVTDPRWLRARCGTPQWADRSGGKPPARYHSFIARSALSGGAECLPAYLGLAFECD
jgi:ABC-type transport system substrate-binding protein